MDQAANRPEEISRATVDSDENVESSVEKCSRRGCDEPADGEASPDLCERHRGEQREYARAYMERKRIEWDKAKACLRCGAAKRAPKNTRCAGCLVETGATPKVEKRVENRSSAIVVSRSEADGFLRKRFHGKMKRGAPSTDEMDAFERKIVDDHMRRFREGMDYLATDEGKSLHPSQQTDARFKALGQLAYAVRAADEILERHRYDQKLSKRREARAAARQKRMERRAAGLAKLVREIAKSGR